MIEIKALLTYDVTEPSWHRQPRHVIEGRVDNSDTSWGGTYNLEIGGVG